MNHLKKVGLIYFFGRKNLVFKTYYHYYYSFCFIIFIIAYEAAADVVDEIEEPEEVKPDCKFIFFFF